MTGFRQAHAIPSTVLVLGGTSDIGLATCRRLAARGTKTIILAGRDHTALIAAASRLRISGSAVIHTTAFDAIATLGHHSLVANLWAQYGPIDLVLLTFGVLEGPVSELICTNYLGAVSVLRPISQKLVEQGNGTIAVLSSVAAQRPRMSNLAYGSSKARLDNYCQGLSSRLAGSGVSVLIVRPGFVTTKMTSHLHPTPLSTTPEQVAHAILAGVEADKQILWVPAQIRWAMLVLRLLPEPIWRRLPF